MIHPSILTSFPLCTLSIVLTIEKLPPAVGSQSLLPRPGSYGRCRTGCVTHCVHVGSVGTGYVALDASRIAHMLVQWALDMSHWMRHALRPCWFSGHWICHTGCVTLGAPYQMRHTGCTVPDASHWVHHTRCVTLGAPYQMRHTECITLSASHWVHHTRCVALVPQTGCTMLDALHLTRHTLHPHAYACALHPTGRVAMDTLLPVCANAPLRRQSLAVCTGTQHHQTHPV